MENINENYESVIAELEAEKEALRNENESLGQQNEWLLEQIRLARIGPSAQNPKKRWMKSLSS